MIIALTYDSDDKFAIRVLIRQDDKGLVPALEELAWLPEEAGFAEIRPVEALKLPDHASLRPSRECLQPRRGGVA